MSCIFYQVYLQFSCLFVFFCTVLQFYALVFCFGGQVLSLDSSLATGFLGVVPLWRVAKRKFFQPCDFVGLEVSLRCHAVFQSFGLK